MDRTELKVAEKKLERATQYYAEGKYQEGYELVKKIEPIIFLKFERWEEYIEVRNHISGFYIVSEIGVNFEKIEQHFVQTLEIASQKLDKKSVNLEMAYGYLGYWYGQIMKNPAKAKPIFETNLQIAFDIHGNVSVEAITAYNNLAYIHAVNENRRAALIYMEKAIYLLEELNKTDKKKPSITHQITFYINLGSFCLETEYREKGEVYLKKALEKCENNDFQEKKHIMSYVYDNFSKFYINKKEYTQALFYSQQTLAIRRKYHSIENTEIASGYFEMGHIYYLLENYQESILFLQKSLDIRVHFFERPNSEVAKSLMCIGKCMYRQKEFEKAIGYCQRAFTYLFPKFQNKNIFDNPKAEHVINNSVCLEIIELKAICLLESYKMDEKEEIKLIAALKILHQSIHLLDSVKRSYQLTQSLLHFLRTFKTTTIFNTAMELTLLTSHPKEAFFFCEKNKANVLLASIQDNYSKVAASIPVSLLNREEELKTKLTFLEKQIAKGEKQREAILLQWKSRYFDLHEEYLQLIQQFETDYPDYHQLKYETKTVSIEEIQTNLSENQVMVNYFIGEDHYYIFLISSNGFEIFEDEKPNDFEALIEGFLQAIQNHQLEEYCSKGYELYQLLLQPFEFDLMDAFEEMDSSSSSENEVLGVANPKQLIIIPHGILSYLSFEALICSPLENEVLIEAKKEDSFNRYHDLDYLLLHCEMSYHYSASLWHYLLQNQAKGERAEWKEDFVGFAPVYQSEMGGEKSEAGSGSSGRGGENEDENKNLQLAAKTIGQWATRSEALRSDGSWTPLPHSKVEAEGIAALFEEKGLATQTFLHKAATKERFREVVESSRFLLIAAHGVVNDEQPKLSGLVFYPDGKQEVGSEKRDTDIVSDTLAPTSRFLLPTSQTDCILSMEETYHLNLQADLVVLSSCESGIGELAKGEGMMAVNRGFLYAGAKNVVSTLFKVYDKPSSLLTQYLFEGVLEGADYTSALRRAKLRLLKMEEVDVKSWCGFVLIGGN